jgi:hypothetical protein
MQRFYGYGLNDYLKDSSVMLGRSLMGKLKPSAKGSPLSIILI